MGGAAAVTPAALPRREALLAAARDAAARAYAPYSRFHVGAALAFADGEIVTGANVENASYGLSLCAETVAAAIAMSAGRRGGLVAVARRRPALRALPAGAERAGAGGRNRPGDLVRRKRRRGRAGNAPFGPPASRLRPVQPHLTGQARPSD
jgi:hypothetical protein